MSLIQKAFLLLGDERCGSKAASVLALCGTGIGVSFDPNPMICAVLSTILISVAPLFVLPFASYLSEPVLLCFACGGLLGDVFLHILPDVLGGGHSHGATNHHDHDHHDHDHDHGHGGGGGGGHVHGIEESKAGLAVLAGFMAFYLVERIVRSGGGGGHHSHGHSHSHVSEHGHDDKAADGHGDGCGEDCDHDHGHAEEPAHAHSHEHGHISKEPTSTLKRRASSPAKKAGSSKAPAAKKAASKKAAAPPVAAAPPASAPPAASVGAAERLIAGYLNLAADAAHNFTDGLMLGAAYVSQGFYGGVAATLACLMHEVPHEVGDVTILMQAGFSRSAAIKSQLLTAGGALLGTLVAVSTGQDSSGLLLSFTAGGFIYIATVDVLPPLLMQPATVAQTLSQVAAMAMGVGMMLLVMYVEAEAAAWVGGGSTGGGHAHAHEDVHSHDHGHDDHDHDHGLEH